MESSFAKAYTAKVRDVSIRDAGKVVFPSLCVFACASFAAMIRGTLLLFEKYSCNYKAKTVRD
eukprot:185996-Amphidinium_carterae.1